MKLITKTIMDKLKKNNKLDIEGDDNGTLPVKLFNATGGQTWLIHSIEENGDIMWGVADLGFGCVEYGPFSLNEMLEAKKTLGFRFMLERDMYWKGGKVSDYIFKETLAGC